MKKNRWITLTGLVLIIINVGFLRDFIFVNINARLSNEVNSLHGVMELFNTFDHHGLMIAKWVLTFFFTIIYLFLTIVVLRLFFIEKKVMRISLLSFLVIMVIAVVCYLVGYLCGFPEEGYRLSRIFMGIVQSPVPLMALIPGFMLLGRGP